MLKYPYQVINPAGETVLQSMVRHSPRVEIDHLEHGYTIRLHGKKLTKTDIRKETQSSAPKK